MPLSKSVLPLFFSLTLSINWLLGAPAVTLVSPNFGPAAGGETVTITGTGFTGVSDVKFGPTSGTIVTSSDTQITVQTPQSVPGTVHISVTVGSDTSPTTPADRYTYQGNWFAYVSGVIQEEQMSDTPTAWYINLADNQIKGDISLLQQFAPGGIAITPDGRTVYVGDRGNEKAATQPKVSANTYVNAIDVILKTSTFIKCNDHMNSPCVAIAPDGTTVYPTFLGEDEVGLIDVATRTLLPTTLSPTGNYPYGIAVSPNGKKIYVANSNGSSATVFEEGILPKTITLPDNPFLIAITPDGSEVYVTSRSNQVYVIDTLSDERKSTISIPGATNCLGIAISPDGRFVYIGDNNLPTVYQINCSTKQIDNTIDCGTTPPIGISIAPDGKTAYVVVAQNDQLIFTVKVIDLTQDPPAVVQTIPFVTEANIGFIAITPDPSPAAEFSVTAGAAGSPTAFNASRSVTAVGTVVQYVWNFGDGSSEETTTTPTVSHTYAQGGTYTVGLTVTNSAGTSVVQTFTGQTVSNNGSFDNAHFEQVITIQSPSNPLKRPHHFRGKILKHHHHLKLTTEWKQSLSPGKIKYQIFEDHKKIYTTKKLHFKKSLHPKDFYKHHLHDYKKYLEHRYSVRAVNAAGQTSPFTHLDME